VSILHQKADDAGKSHRVAESASHQRGSSPPQQLGDQFAKGIGQETGFGRMLPKKTVSVTMAVFDRRVKVTHIIEKSDGHAIGRIPTMATN